MAVSESKENKPFYKNIRFFPTVTENKINISEFLDAVSDLILVVDRMGKVFAPVKYDMQGNLNKIKKGNYTDKHSEMCLLELLKSHIEIKYSEVPEGLAWLSRTMLFFEIMLQEIVKCLESNNTDESMRKILAIAYEGSVKKYHNWITQQIFLVIGKMSPSLCQIMKSLEVDSPKEYKDTLVKYIILLNRVRCEIDQVFISNNIFQ